MRRHGLVAGIAAVASVAVGAVSAADPRPLVGTNYSHFHRIVNCNIDGGGIVADGALQRTTIRRQLAAMRAGGIETIRLLVWHLSDQEHHRWGVISSRGGIPAYVRENLARFAADVRAAGFDRLTVAFGPMWKNDPIGFGENRWEPSLFDENWNVIRAVRAVVKPVGPPATRFDLLNEGAPSDYLATRAQLADYVARMYARYVDAYGSDDVTVSSIVGWNDQSRLSNLIDALRATGRPLPTWFEVHAGGPTLLEDLRATERTLQSKGLTQPIVLGETSYNDAAGAEAIRAFVASSSRLEEVMQWPLALGSPCGPISASAPHSADAYVQAVTGALPSTALTATLTAQGRATAVTPYGQPLTALRAGTYTLAVTDRSAADGLRLRGPRTARTTPAAFRGMTTWTLTLAPGTYRYGPTRVPLRRYREFVVLATG